MTYLLSSTWRTTNIISGVHSHVKAHGFILLENNIRKANNQS